MSKARELSKLPNYVLSTVAELKLAVGKEQGDKAFIGGYYVDGDGGGGDFYWDSVSVEADNGGTIFQVTGTVTGRWKRIYSGSVNVKWFGAKGDGVTDDTTSIKLALAVNGSVTFNKEDTYHLGSFANDGTAIPLFTINTTGSRLETNGCKFTVNASTNLVYSHTALQTIFMIDDVSDVTIGDFEIISTGIERTTGAVGTVAILIKNTLVNTRWITIGDIKATTCLSVITIGSADPALYRCRGINIKNISSDGCYYGLNCANNGDYITAIINSNDIVRSYFVYGIQGHRIKVNSTNHNKFQDINISTVSYNTKDITIDYNGTNTNSDAPIHINDNSTTGTGVISNIEINANVTMSNPANPSVWFSIYNGAGAFISGNTLFDNIRINGNTNSTTPVVFNSQINTGENISNIFLSEGYQKNLKDTGRYIINEVNRSRIISRTHDGVSTNLPLYFNVSDLKFVSSWAILTLWGANNPTASSTDYVMQQYRITFNVDSSGNVTHISQNQIYSYTDSISYTSTTFINRTGTFDLLILLNGFSASTGRVKGKLEVYSGAENL